ncbi:hypothetical protein SAMD00019534_117780 [Acytostelium subglobosum LB1]|uniref:hypothetical protein n=1 Tax=Acytostelium subglobosum LB1 TaxID=1410327 RepID=UPI0006452214|nr:hypothetical protein SAMD00019534_117780 [Acytostelium subglobosum LB1]GAM28602.1 hypothetical protein SAMD00019534_117780 [Acytostelium subglobosum LB1]|eukprot:XP_012748380.1 hypothetical protein SAMD00019534_117780 [Acytostelium subglobosum LB1]
MTTNENNNVQAATTAPHNNDQVIYEVTAFINSDMAEKWGSWIPKHVNEIVSLENGALFTKGVIHKLDRDLPPATPTEGVTTFVIHYYATSQEALDKYLNVYGPQLRQDAINQFGTGLKTSRRVYTAIQEIDALPQTKTFGYVF